MFLTYTEHDPYIISRLQSCIMVMRVAVMVTLIEIESGNDHFDAGFASAGDIF